MLYVFLCHSQDIHRTACQGKIDRLDSLLQSTDLHAQDDQGRSLLHWAVGCNQHEVFAHLVALGIDINWEDREGNTALYVAVQFDRDSLFDQLIELQADQSWIAKEGAQLLERAILDQRLSYVKKLVNLGVELEVTNAWGSTPLVIAARIGADEIATWLREQGADESKIQALTMKGPYMGQQPPGLNRAVFAPNFISIEQYEFGSVFSKDGTEFFYAVALGNKPIVRYSKLIEGVWSQPETILSHDKYGFNDPFLSPDESRLYFISKRNMEGTDAKEDHDIWYVERQSSGWSEPINAGTNINSSDNEYYISFTTDGTMYFASNVNAEGDTKQSNQDIYYAPFVDGEFQKAVRLPDEINTAAYEADVFVDPEEAYLIFCSRRAEGFGRGDMYISFKDENGSWTQATNMGNLVNTEYHELCPFVTADGKYLFYTSNQDIYWVGAEVIEQLRKEAFSE